MNNTFLSARVALVACFVTSSVAMASATTVVVDGSIGKVLVNHGGGFVPVADGALLNVGDQLVVGEESSVSLAFEGCTVSVVKPTVMSITDVAPCENGQQAVVDDVFVSPTADLPDPGLPYAAAPAFPLPLLLLGGAIAVGSGYYIFGVLDDNNSPNSKY